MRPLNDRKDSPVPGAVATFGAAFNKAPLVAILLVGFFLCAPGIGTASDTGTNGDEPTFESDIRPIFKTHCFHCHGEDGQLEGGLDLRLVRFMLHGGDSGPALVADDSQASLIVKRLTTGDMPPGEKKPTAREIAQVAAWISAGAKVASPEPESPTFTDSELKHWAFRPIARPPVPTVQQSGLVRTPIDAFLLARLEAQGLSYSPPADRRTLVRRAYFDLLGLPPSPEQVEAFVTDPRDDAWPRLIDQLLESPQYGERWGRIWLDLAGYADSDGGSEKDVVRPHAYLYRDYVIRSLNADKPFDEFLREQLAGDETLKAPYQNLSPNEAERLIATGFLRMGPDATSDSQADKNAASNDVLAETVKIVSTTLLGMTVGCAQCHSHKYEPIPQVDYYRLRAIFEPAYDWKRWRTPAQRLVPMDSLATEEQRQRVAEFEAKSAQLKEQEKTALTELIQERFAAELSKLPADQRASLREAFLVPAAQRTKAQSELLAKYPALNITLDNIAKLDPSGALRVKTPFLNEFAQLQKEQPELPQAQALTEIPGKMPKTFVFVRGDFNRPSQEVHPADLSIVTGGNVVAIRDDDPALPTTGRRTAYAAWLTSGKHPLVGRVLVNRVWLNHFGRGIVATPGDFGLSGQRPSHPELLDWLANEWLARGWKLKSLHRLLMNSTAYQQSSRRRPELDRVDPENQWLGRMSLRRLEAEMVRDAILVVTGLLNDKMYGPPVPVSPDEQGQVVVAVDTRDRAGRSTGRTVDLGNEVYRRSIYIQSRRTLPLDMLETFDAPRMSPNCELRNYSTAAPQSLLLLNNTFILEQAAAFAAELRRGAPNDLDEQISLAWRRVYSALPTPAQRERAKRFLADQTANVVQGSGTTPGKKAELERIQAAARDTALETLCQALLCSNRFLYID